MDTLAPTGGAGLEKALAADDVEDLAKALKTVAQRVRPCRFNIPATLDPSQNLNPFELNFFLSGKEVTRDRTRLRRLELHRRATRARSSSSVKSCEAIRGG